MGIIPDARCCFSEEVAKCFTKNLHSTMNSLAEIDMNSPVSPADPLKWSLQDLLRENEDGLAHVPVQTLRKCVKPVMDGLRSIDAEALLQLEGTTNGGAIVDKGVFAKPIHQQIQPPCSEDTVRYIHLSDMPGQYSMGIFVFPPNSKIPLHDHPGMCVLSRILYGSLERLSLDLIREEEDCPSSEGKRKTHSAWRSSWMSPKTEKNNFPAGTRRAYKNHVDHLQAPECTVLYPFEGNLHEFHAGPEGAAVLDVLFPPYNDHDRDCTFYNVVDRMGDSNDDHQQPCWIIPTGQPEDFHCISGRYRSLGCD